MVKSIVKEIGEFAFFEDEPIIILFNTTAPEGLKEVCVLHDYQEEPTSDLLQVGSKIYFGSQEYRVKEIGNLANSSLKELGHASFYFDLAPDQELLPGSVSLEPHQVPSINEGDEICFSY
ncbi:PTS glucitol/sorbitol transporter subunit IIA [Vagococcus allomyrinae]|uniref:PTS glucitol/sorbitol transporter subunit IIA n=1 Tax=Vagococcus allomyrinae TaxID=2794353 RepID=A0A940P905_9ENTE|nr:PTS glucitol/sorbitol transporter subunit IIA [Vagococcus allomyrinae]MBP1043552.1 PTS glucitol/sorbitol transporter subunit IIA [Vagococcus allomyrinae]